MTRLYLPSLCAISLVTTHFGIGSEQLFGDLLNVFYVCVVIPPWAFIHLPQERAAECERGVHKGAYVQRAGWLQEGSAGAAIEVIMGTRDRGAIDVS